jgi:RimJ/RimL family protein N-acetyltransferase
MASACGKTENQLHAIIDHDKKPVTMTFDLQPHLRGELVELRPLHADDWPALLAVAYDPLIWEQHPQRNRHEREVFEGFFRAAIAEANTGTGGALAVLDRATGAIIGSTRFHGWDPRASEVEIGWTFLARSHWGGRYNGEMKRLLLAHAFRFVERVIFLVGEGNIRSQTAMTRVGAKRDGLVEKVDSGGVSSRSVRFVIDRPR